MGNTDYMRNFLEPDTVALIGVSKQTGEGSFNILLNMIDFGFQGRLYVINPFVKEIQGVKAYPDLRSVPEKIDLAVISTAPHSVPGGVRDCVAAGIKAIIIITQGFADAGEEGLRLQKEIVGIAEKGGARIMGPNTVGVVNQSKHFNTMFVPLPKAEEKTSISFVAQTGLFSQGISRFTYRWKYIDLGNACDVGFADVLEYLEDDPDTKLIALHIEGINHGRRFLEVARRVARKKPILAIKTGKSAKGAGAAISHSGSMTGRDEIYEAALRQAGIVRVSNVDELEDLMKAFLYLPPMQGTRVGMATPTGAAGVIASDACETYGLEMAELSETTRRRLGELSPEWLRISNPMDVLPACFLLGYQEAYRRILKALLEDNSTDAVICFVHAIEPGNGHILDISDILIELAPQYDKPLIPWIYWGVHRYKMRTKLEGIKNMVVYHSLERAIRALAVKHKYSEFDKRR
ncbi:MAG: CoA-binding protein [Pseudomonadota bacterium]